MNHTAPDNELKSVAAEKIIAALHANGFDAYSGVPCSTLAPLMAAAGAHEKIDYLAASVEGEAVAYAAGAWLAGSLGVVMLQNSGLGNVINPLVSLALPYKIPMLLILSWRGEPGRPDAIHHSRMGKVTLPLLELLEIPTKVLEPSDNVAMDIAATVKTIRCTRNPHALVIRNGVFDQFSQRSTAPRKRSQLHNEVKCLDFGDGAFATRQAVVEALMTRVQDAPVIATTGFMSRALSSLADAPTNFYMQGSMGFAAAIGLGVARHIRSRVFVLDGDGSLLMRLGTLPTIGAAKPENLVHIVVDNQRYASTGGQFSVSNNVDFAALSLNCGYASAARCHGRSGLDDAISWCLKNKGPTLLWIGIHEQEPSVPDRPELSLPAIADRFREHLLRLQ